MYNRNATPKNEKPTTELFVVAVTERQECKKHSASIGWPCWGIIQADGLYMNAVCNTRARKAGFNHPIRPESLRLNRQSHSKKK